MVGNLFTSNGIETNYRDTKEEDLLTSKEKLDYIDNIK